MLLQAGRYGKLLRKLTSFIGADPVIEVPDQLIPTIVLENDRFEYGVLRRELPWCWTDLLSAVAANFTAVGVAQGTPGMITVVEGIAVSNSTSTGANYHIRLLNNVTNDVIGNVFGRDTRSTQLVNGNTSTLRFRRTQVANPGSNVIDVSLPPLTTLIIPVKFLLSVPVVGGGFAAVGVVPDIVNSQVDASFWGYERNAEPYEIE
jgi:hypothetical protein